MACPNHPERVSGLVGCGRCGLGYCSDCLVTVQGRPYCASCKDAQLRDLAAGPTVELARPGSRFVAQLVDTVVIMIGVVVLTIVVTVTGAKEAGGLILILGVIVGVVAYEGLMLSQRGQTLGKMATHIRVVSADGSPIGAGQAWGRAVTRAVLGYIPGVGLVDALMVFSQGRRTLHDHIASTRVVQAR